MTTTNTRSKKIKPHKSKFMKNFVLSASAAFGEDYLSAMAEPPWNAWDAGANEILIEYVVIDGVPCVRIIDDGIGMNETRRNAFLNYGDSQWLNAQARGKNGTGRLGGLHHGEFLSAETKPSGEDLHVTRFSAAQFQDALMNGTELYWEAFPLPARHPIKTTGTVITIHNLGKGEGVSPGTHRTAKRLIDNLAKLLPVDLARMIRVKDESGTVYELKQRKLRGQVIEGEHHDVPLVGDVRYRLGVVDRHDEVDKVELFAISKICTLGEFFAAVAMHDNPAVHVYLKTCRAVLEHPLVSGIIDIPFLNRFVGDDRNRVGERLFDQQDALLSILRFLREELVPKVENTIGLKSDQIERSDDETILRSLVEDLGVPGRKRKPGGPGTPTGNVSLSVDTKFFVLCGQKHTISVRDPRPNGTIAWDIRSGGTLDATVGSRVTLTACGSPTRGEIRVTETVPGEPTLEATVRPDVVAEMPFQFDIAVRSAARYERITLKLRYPARVAGKIEWSAPEGTALDKKGDPDGIGIEEVVFSAPFSGDFSVEAAVPDADLLKVCTVRVSEGNGADIVSSSRVEFSYEGETYELQARNYPPGTGDGHVISPHAGGSGRWVVRVNMANGAIADRPDIVKKALLLLHVAGFVAEIELNKERARDSAQAVTPEKLRKKTNEVYAALLARKKAGA